MDLLLESLRTIYEDLDDEQQVLQEIEDALLQPDDQDIEDDANDEDKLQLKPIDEPSQVPQQVPPQVPQQKQQVPAQATQKQPVAPQAPQQKQQVPAQATQKNTLPDINTSAVGVPNKPKAAPNLDKVISVQKKEKPSSSTEKQKIYKKLQNLRDSGSGKIFKTKLNSRALSYLSYNPRTKGLNVTFTKNNRSYHYKNVGMEKAAELISSNHKGTLFNRDIKKTSPYKEI
jgi:hypothetical protein